MRVRVFEDAAAVAVAGAEIVAAEVEAKPSAVLALPTGNTALPFYAELERRHRARELDLSRARAFNLDELALPPEHPASFRSYMERHAWGRIGLDRRRCHILDPLAEEAGECRRYDREIDAAGGFDLAVLGLGADGHVAYNLPGAAAEDCHRIELPEAVADSLGIAPEWRPLRALTLGLGPLRRAGRVLLMATGRVKREAATALLNGPVSLRWPCTRLREHPSLDVLLDRSAAGDP